MSTKITISALSGFTWNERMTASERPERKAGDHDRERDPDGDEQRR
jgi:hypothetical protein